MINMKKSFSKDNLHQFRTYFANILLPCLVFGAITGALSGAAVFGFLRLAGLMTWCFGKIWAVASASPVGIALLFLGLIFASFVVAIVLHRCPTARGGGIPTSVGYLRGVLSFSWLPTLICTVASACVTYLCGIPLGTEGPSVQIGTALARGVGKMAGDKNRAWDRYIMTAGSCAGFAAATFSPVTGIFFALEEAHRRFSPMILMTAASGVTSSMIVTRALCSVFHVSTHFLHLPDHVIPPISSVWLAFLMGIGGALLATLYGFLYKALHELVKHRLARVPLFIRLAAVFVLVGIFGLLVPHVLGSGHSLVDLIFEEPYALGLGALLLILLLRVILILLANNAGVTGGVFIPTLTVGALYGVIAARGCLALGVSEELCSFLTLLGMMSFFAGVNRIPITALVFSMEQLKGAEGIVFLCASVFTSYLVMELFRVPSFSDLVLENRISEEPTEGEYINTKVTVMPHSFVIGKPIRDVLWPAGCRVLDVFPKNGGIFNDSINEGDQLRLRIRTARGDSTEQELCALIGEQDVL